MKVFQIKIQLKNFKPSNYRKIFVSPNIIFYRLNLYIQDLFGFDGYHSSVFEKYDGKKLNLCLKYE